MWGIKSRLDESGLIGGVGPKFLQTMMHTEALAPRLLHAPAALTPDAGICKKGYASMSEQHFGCCQYA